MIRNVVGSSLRRGSIVWENGTSTEASAKKEGQTKVLLRSTDQPRSNYHGPVETSFNLSVASASIGTGAF